MEPIRFTFTPSVPHNLEAFRSVSRTYCRRLTDPRTLSRRDLIYISIHENQEHERERARGDIGERRRSIARANNVICLTPRIRTARVVFQAIIKHRKSAVNLALHYARQSVDSYGRLHFRSRGKIAATYIEIREWRLGDDWTRAAEEFQFHTSRFQLVPITWRVHYVTAMLKCTILSRPDI